MGGKARIFSFTSLSLVVADYPHTDSTVKTNILLVHLDTGRYLCIYISCNHHGDLMMIEKNLDKHTCHNVTVRETTACYGISTNVPSQEKTTTVYLHACMHA